MRIRTAVSLFACVLFAAIGCQQAETNGNCCNNGSTYVAPSSAPVYSTPAQSFPASPPSYGTPDSSYSTPSYSAPSYSAPSAGSGSRGFSSGSGSR